MSGVTIIFSAILLTTALNARAQTCSKTDAEARAPEKSQMMFYSDNRKAQMVCPTGWTPEYLEQSTLHCKLGQWEGELSTCIPQYCKKSALDILRAKNWTFEFSPDSGSERMPHESHAIAKCGPEHYASRENEDDKYQYTTDIVESYTCHYGTWVGQLRNKCTEIPEKFPIYGAHYFDVGNTYHRDYWYRNRNNNDIPAGNAIGVQFEALDPESDQSICPERVKIYQMKRVLSDGTQHRLVVTESMRDGYIAGGWIQGVATGDCVLEKGQCGLFGELHEFYIGGVETTYVYRRNLTVLGGQPNVHKGILCYIH